MALPDIMTEAQFGSAAGQIVEANEMDKETSEAASTVEVEPVVEAQPAEAKAAAPPA